MRYRYQSGDIIYEVELERHDEGYRVTIDGAVYALDLIDSQPGALSLRLQREGEPVPAGAARPQVVYWDSEGDVRWLSAEGCTFRLARPAARRARSGGPSALAEGLRVRAPMPALVRTLKVGEGESVEAGQTLLLLEAMKMEIRLPSPQRARVARLLAQPGQTVERDQVLVELEAE